MTKRFDVPIAAHWAYYDGEIMPLQDVLVPAATNLGLRLGLAVFETIRGVGGRACWLAHHAKRLAAGLASLTHSNYEEGSVLLQLQDITRALAEKNALVGGIRFRVTVWLEGEARGYGVSPDARLVWLAEAFPFAESAYTLPAPIVLGVVEGIHSQAGRPNNLKSTQAWAYTEASWRATEQGWDDALLLSAEGHVLETSRSNVFMVTNGRLITPRLDATGGVAGVIRQVVLSGAANLGYSAQEQAITVADLLGAEEVFCTNVVAGIMPVGRFLCQQQAGNVVDKTWQAHRFATMLQEALLTKPALF